MVPAIADQVAPTNMQPILQRLDDIMAIVKHQLTEEH
jgi:hypothetical protein